MNFKKELKIRALQFYTANHKAAPAEYRRFMDTAVKCGFNFINICNYGRIRTEVFHGLPPEDSYSSDEIREFVNCAAEYGLEVIPNLELFGHADIFLERPEFEFLAELRGGRNGCFSARKMVFCPSLPDTYEFIQKYLTEISALFPGQYINAGMDEVWDIGYCELCSARLKHESAGDLYAGHVIRCHDIIVNQLKKKMMMWDDMFDLYPDALLKIPRDIILLSWHYEDLVELPLGHTGGGRSDHFAIYDRLGFQYLFAPSTYSLRNISTFTDYAVHRNPLGALLTIWDNMELCRRPALVYSGRLWNNQETSPEAAIAESTPLKTTGEIALAHSFLTTPYIKLSLDHLFYLRGPLNRDEFQRSLLVKAAGFFFQHHENDSSEFMRELLLKIGMEELYFLLRSHLCHLYDPQNSKPPETCKKEILRLAKKLSADFQHLKDEFCPNHRGGLSPEYFQKLENMIDQLPDHGPLSEALLEVRYEQDTKTPQFFVLCKNDRVWRKITANISWQHPISGEFQFYYPFTPVGEPESLRVVFTEINSGGNVKYLEIKTRNNRYVPTEIVKTEGMVFQPEAILEDDSDVLRFGHETRFLQRLRNQQILEPTEHSVEIKLKSFRCSGKRKRGVIEKKEADSQN